MLLALILGAANLQAMQCASCKKKVGEVEDTVVKDLSALKQKLQAFETQEMGDLKSLLKDMPGWKKNIQTRFEDFEGKMKTLGADVQKAETALAKAEAFMTKWGPVIEDDVMKAVAFAQKYEKQLPKFCEDLSKVIAFGEKWEPLLVQLGGTGVKLTTDVTSLASGNLLAIPSVVSDAVGLVKEGAEVVEEAKK